LTTRVSGWPTPKTVSRKSAWKRLSARLRADAVTRCQPENVALPGERPPLVTIAERVQLVPDRGIGQGERLISGAGAVGAAHRTNDRHPA
jgi:hypothetical protein